jgi:hypothetical protein
MGGEGRETLCILSGTGKIDQKLTDGDNVRHSAHLP